MKKRNPNDSTFRNITALKKRVAALEVLTKKQGRLLKSHGISGTTASMMRCLRSNN